ANADFFARQPKLLRQLHRLATAVFEQLCCGHIGHEYLSVDKYRRYMSSLPLAPKHSRSTLAVNEACNSFYGVPNTNAGQNDRETDEPAGAEVSAAGAADAQGSNRSEAGRSAHR